MCHYGLTYSCPLISEAGLMLSVAAKNVNEGITAALAVHAVLPPGTVGSLKKDQDICIAVEGRAWLEAGSVRSALQVHWGWRRLRRCSPADPICLRSCNTTSVLSTRGLPPYIADFVAQHFFYYFISKALEISIYRQTSGLLISLSLFPLPPPKSNPFLCCLQDKMSPLLPLVHRCQAILHKHPFLLPISGQRVLLELAGVFNPRAELCRLHSSLSPVPSG